MPRKKLWLFCWRPLRWSIYHFYIILTAKAFSIASASKIKCMNAGQMWHTGSSRHHKIKTNKASEQSSKMVKGKWTWFEEHLEILTTPNSPCYVQISTTAVLQLIIQKKTWMLDNDGKGFALKLDRFVIFLMQGRLDLWSKAWCVTKRAVTRRDAWWCPMLTPLQRELWDSWP